MARYGPRTIRRALAGGVVALLALGVPAVGQDPDADRVPLPGDTLPPILPPAGPIIPVQLPENLLRPPTSPGAGDNSTAQADPQLPSGLLRTPGGGGDARPSQSGAPAAATNTGTATAGRAESTPTAGATSVTGSGGAAGAAINAPDAGDLLAKSAASVGTAVQRRNAIVADPRIRGWRAGQYQTVGDGGLFSPARLDLDTAVSKFDSGSVRDIVVVKGPYSALYGPGFSFLDVATLDAPRFKTFESHGRTSLNYQDNGRRWDALQSFSAGDADWGARVTYNYLQGNDYLAGNGTSVPASYLSHNVNFALGFNLTEKTSLELKGQRVTQSNLEFPGLYFDIAQLDTQAYTAHYAAVDQGLFDKFAFDFYYNSTAATGNTRSTNKQNFVQQLLAQSFNPQLQNRVVPVAQLVGNPQYALFRDDSDTRFAGRSIGYKAAFAWGENKDDPLLTAGTSLNVFGQGLVENIRFQQYQGTSIATGLPVDPGNPQTLNQNQSVPEANQVTPGLFLQALLPVTDRLNLRTGGRLDWVRSSSNPRAITGNIDLFGQANAPGQAINRLTVDPLIYSADPTNGALTRDYHLISGFLRGEYKLDDHWTSLLAVGYAQRAPSITELYAAGPFVGVLQQGTSRLIGDPNLKPEKLTQLDIGLTGRYDYLQVGANAFYAYVNDYITYDQNKSGLGLTQVVYTNTDRAALAGAELFGQTDVTGWLSPFGTLSYVQGTDLTARDTRRAPDLDSSRRDDPLTLRRKAATEPLPQMPPLESRFGLRFHGTGAAPKWQVEFAARVVNGQNNVATSLNELPTPGFTTFNVRGFWKITDQFLFTGGVENLGNKTYREHLDPISGNLLGVDALLRPGRTFFFGSQYSF